MCGRIAQIDTPDELADLLGLQAGLAELHGVRQSYNVAPSSRILAIGADATGHPLWTTFTWGMLPEWMRSRRAVINARCETADQKPMFRRPFRVRRCVIPATAYYEWLSEPSGKQPFCIRMSSGAPLLLAGLYTGRQCVIMTRQARHDLAFIHHRMPVAMPPDMVEPFLQDTEAAYASFGAAETLDIQAYPVNRGVGRPSFNEPACLQPLEA